MLPTKDGMAEYAPIQHEDHYIERDTGTNNGFWAIVVVLAIVLLALLFGSRLFGRSNTGTGTNINGTVNVPPSSTSTQ